MLTCESYMMISCMNFENMILDYLLYVIRRNNINITQTIQH